MPKFQIETRRGFKYEIETDDETELDGIVGQIESDEEAEFAKSRPLPEGVTPTVESAGGGRGFVNPELPTETPRMGGRRGGTRAEAKPFVAQGERELLDQPMPAGQKTPETNQDQMLRPEFVDSVRAKVGQLAPERRMAELQRLAGGKTVEARAAREVLRQVGYEARRITPADEDMARTLGARPASAEGKGPGKKATIPSIDPTIRDIDERRTPAEIAGRRETAAGVADSNLGVDAIAQRDLRLQAADTSGLRRVADVGVSAAGGAVSGFKLISDAFGAGSQMSQMLEGVGNLVDRARSAASIQDDQTIDGLMKEAQDKGVGDQILAAARAFSVKPAEFIAQGIGTSVPAILAGLLPGVRESTIAGLAAGATTGAAMGAGTIKGGIYDEIKKELAARGMSADEAETRAKAAQAYTSDNAGQIALGAVLGGLASATGQEGVALNMIKRVMGREAGKAAAKEATGGLIGAALKGGAVEAVPEFLQGGQEQLAKNLALSGEGIETPAMQGVVGQGALEALAGFGSGALVSGLERRAPAATNFTPADSSTQAAGLTDIVVPIPEVPDVGVPDAAGGLAAGGGAGLGAQPVGGVADPGSAPAVDGGVGDAAVRAGTAGGAAQPVRDVATGGAAPALTDPVARTSDADLLARLGVDDRSLDEKLAGLKLGTDDNEWIAQPAGPVAAQPGAGNGQGQEAEVLNPAADKAAQKDAAKALADAQQKAQRADDMLRAAQALGEPDTIEVARRVQLRAQADLTAAQQRTAALQPKETTTNVPTTAELGAQAREAGAPQAQGQGQAAPVGEQGAGRGAGAAAELTERAPIRRRDLATKTTEELQADLDEARTNNRRVSIEGIRRFFGEQQAAEASLWSDRKIDKWLADNETAEASDWMQARYINDGLIGDMLRAGGDFDDTSARDLGRSIAVAAKDVDQPGFEDTPAARTLREAFSYAKRQGWSLDDVVAGMRGRAEEWAGSNAPELFQRLYREAGALASTSIGGEWQAFAPETGTKAVPRAEMPQIKAEHRGALTQFLGARGVTHEQVEIAADELKPTQAEFSPAKVQSMVGADIGRSILVSSDGYVLDGHHQWLAAKESGQAVKAIRLDAPIDELLPLAREFPSSTLEDGATTAAPKAPAASAALVGPQRAMLDSSLRAIERARAQRYGEQSSLKLAEDATPEEQAAIAFAEANGVKVAIVEETGKSNFSGVAINGINVLVRGKDTDQVLAVAVHEGIHTLDKDIKAALISAIEPTLRNRGLFDEIYRYGSSAEVRAEMTAEEIALEDAKITEEMVAMLGQSEAKRPEFWTKLATKMGDTAFGKFARHVLGKLDSMMGKYIASEKIVRDAWTTDLPLVQNALAEAYASQLKRRGLSKDADRALAQYVSQDRAAQFSQRVYHGGAKDVDAPGQQFSNKQTETPEFKRWFGDSKVVDADGRPLVVYHGTAENFSEFDPRRSGKNYRSAGGQRGFFFTSSPKTASVYAEKPAFAMLDPDRPDEADFGEGTANIMPVYLSLQNPLIVKTAKVSDKFFDTNKESLYARADARGHDGIIVRGADGGGRSLFVALHPGQIKSAIGNDGAFDPANPDIRFSNALTATDDQLAQLGDRKVTIDVDTGDGKTAKMTMGAADAVRDIQARIEAAKKLVECLK